MGVKDIMIAITIRLDARGPRGVAVSSRRSSLLPSSQLAGWHTPCMTNTNTNTITKQPTMLPTGRWAQKQKNNKGGHTKKTINKAIHNSKEVTNQNNRQRRSHNKTSNKGSVLFLRRTSGGCATILSPSLALN